MQNLFCEIIYADDTLIVDERGDVASTHMKYILKQSEHYSLTFNYDKLAMIYINCDPIIAEPSRCNISCSQSMVCLWSFIERPQHVRNKSTYWINQ